MESEMTALDIVFFFVFPLMSAFLAFYVYLDIKKYERQKALERKQESDTKHIPPVVFVLEEYLDISYMCSIYNLSDFHAKPANLRRIVFALKHVAFELESLANKGVKLEVVSNIKGQRE